MGDAAMRNRGMTGLEKNIWNLFLGGYRLAVDRNIGEEPFQVDLLMVLCPDEPGRHLPGDGDHRRMVELGIVKAVQEMDCAGTSSADTSGKRA